LEKYVHLRNAGLIVNEKGEKLAALNPRAAEVLKRVAITGEISRGEVFRIIEMSERTGRNVLRSLLDEGFLTSKSEKGLLRLGFPVSAAGFWFPELYPTENKN
jgi:Fic family protein